MLVLHLSLWSHDKRTMNDSEDFIEKLLKETFESIEAQSRIELSPGTFLVKSNPFVSAENDSTNLMSVERNLLDIQFMSAGIFRLIFNDVVIDYPRNWGIFSDIYESMDWPEYRKVYTLEEFDEDRVIFNLLRTDRPFLEGIFLLQGKGQLKLLMVESENRSSALMFLDQFLNSEIKKVA